MRFKSKFMLGAIAVASLMHSLPVQAQEWPTRPVRIVVPAGPGGGTDIVTRLLSQPLSEVLGQPVVVENKAGAGTTLGADHVAKGPKDGYTLLMINNSHSVSAALYKSIPYDAVKDFEFITLVANAGLLVTVLPDNPAKSLADLVAQAKANPGKINFASVGVGTTQHFAGELLRQVTGIELKHIPYRTTPATIAALRAQEVQVIFELIQPLQGQVRSGDLKALAVTSPQRYPELPNVPTAAESGLPGYDVVSWYALAVPRGTAKPIVDKLNKAMKDVLARENVRKLVLQAGATVSPSTPEEATKHVGDEVAKWRGVMEKAGIPQQ
jgi:tripartite-type tricarboxylate transporter receptor subunit TctC